MDYYRASGSTLAVLDMQAGDVLHYSLGDGPLRQVVMRDAHPACAALIVDGQPFDLLPAALPSAINGVHLWYDRLVDDRVRLAIWPVQGETGPGRICPEWMRWPDRADRPPMRMDAVIDNEGGWDATRVWADDTVWRLQSRDGALRWHVYQAESEYALDPRLLRWQSVQDERVALRLPLAAMPPLKPLQVGQRLTLVYLGVEQDVRWNLGDTRWVDGPFAETTFAVSGVHAIELRVGPDASADSAVQWVTVSG